MYSRTNSGISESTRGFLFVIGAYLTWGFFPLYWILLVKIPEFEVLSHRALWSALMLFAILLTRRNWSWLPKLWHEKSLFAWLALSSLALSINWVLFIWAAGHGHVLDASFGYFINPLISVLLGYVLLGERLSRTKKISISLASLGVAWLAWQGGHMPWLALGLAISFGLYGFFRKISKFPPLEGLSVEMFLMLPFALGYLLFLEIHGSAHFAHISWLMNGLLVGTGIVSIIPLLLFAAGAPKISMTTLGLTQYIAPSGQFLIGVWILHEPINHIRLIGFALIWMALAVYSYSGVKFALEHKKRLAQP